MTNKIEQLIAIIKEYSIIYNMTLPEFKDTRKKDYILGLYLRLYLK
jgi:hypothetical protein